MQTYKIAIVGSGISGLSAGQRLAKIGHEVTVFERFDEPQSIGAGILLQPSGLVALEMLGLLEPIEAKAARIDALLGETKRGQRIMDVRYADVWPAAYALGIHRGNLFSVLYDAAIAAGVQLQCATEISGIDPLDNGRYICRSRGGKMFGEFDGVIIANGTQSRLRACLNVKQQDVPYPWGALWTICPDAEQRYRGALLQRYDGASVMIGVLPSGMHPQTGTPCVSFFWSLKTKDYPGWRMAPLDVWKNHVLGYWPELDYLIGNITVSAGFTFAAYGDVIMNRWHDGALVCIGDAGHGMSPQLGQGANLALIDAVTLADCIAQSPNLPQAFAAYTRRRRRHLKYCQLASRWLTPFFQSDSHFAAFARDLSFPLLNKVPYLYKQAIRTVAGVKSGLVFGKSVFDPAQKGLSFARSAPRKGSEALRK